jgi:hypothetical protein
MEGMLAGGVGSRVEAWRQERCWADTGAGLGRMQGRLTFGQRIRGVKDSEVMIDTQVDSGDDEVSQE